MILNWVCCVFFFFQAEDGIRDDLVTGVQTCALPIFLHQFGSPEQKERWLMPLLDGEIRSAFAMTEPDVGSSDATNIRMRIDRDGDEYVLNGRKWWTSNAMHPNIRILIVMGKTDPEAPTYQQQSMVLVP